MLCVLCHLLRHRTTCALTIVAAAVAASIPADAAKLGGEHQGRASGAAGAHHHPPHSRDASGRASCDGCSSSSSSSYACRAWLLGDVEDGSCTVKAVGSGPKGRPLADCDEELSSASGSYDPPEGPIHCEDDGCTASCGGCGSPRGEEAAAAGGACVLVVVVPESAPAGACPDDVPTGVMPQRANNTSLSG